MIVAESQIFPKWLLILVILLFICILFGLFCWYLIYRRRNIQNSNRKNPEKIIPTDKKPVQRNFPSKNQHLSSTTQDLPAKSWSTSSPQLTNTDIAYLDKLVRTASDRSMWKRGDYPTKDHHNKPRKVPSGQI